jgi:1-acyl-sn-glycerol-3-phosphate acyltransferase
VSLLRFLLRIIPLLWLILVGLVVAATLFPWQSDAHRQLIIRTWSSTLLKIFGVGRQVSGTWPGHQPLVVVSNHISWLDIFVIQSNRPLRFVSKAEVRSWPIFGWLSDQTGTLFLQRQSRRQTAVIGAEMTRALKAGHSLCFFPEGTTTEGRQLLPFKSSMFQCAVDSGTPVLPLLLDYRLGNGKPNTTIPFVGEMTLVRSLWNVLSGPGGQVLLQIGSPIPPSPRRHELSAQAEEAAHRLLSGL